MLSGYMSWTSVRLLLYTGRDKLCKGLNNMQNEKGIQVPLKQRYFVCTDGNNEFHMSIQPLHRQIESG